MAFLLPLCYVYTVLYNRYLHFKRWLCKNESEMTVHSVASMYDIVVSGGTQSTRLTSLHFTSH